MDAEECYRRVRFRTFEELHAKLLAWEHEYNHFRPHLALRGKAQVERLCELRITVSRSVKGMGIAVPTFIPPLVAAATAILLRPAGPPPWPTSSEAWGP